MSYNKPTATRLARKLKDEKVEPIQKPSLLKRIWNWVSFLLVVVFLSFIYAFALWFLMGGNLNDL